MPRAEAAARSAARNTATAAPTVPGTGLPAAPAEPPPDVDPDGVATGEAPPDGSPPDGTPEEALPDGTPSDGAPDETSPDGAPDGAAPGEVPPGEGVGEGGAAGPRAVTRAAACAAWSSRTALSRARSAG